MVDRRTDVPRPHRATTSCSIPATGGRSCWRRAPATSARPCSARPTSVGRGTRRRKPPAFRTGDRLERSVQRRVLADAGTRPTSPASWYAGGSPQGLFRTDDGGDTWDAGRRLERPPDVGDVGGVARGGHARRVDAALGDRRSARPGAPVHRAVGGRRVREHRRRRRLEAAQRRVGRRRSCPIPSPSSGTTRTASDSTRSDPTGSTSRTTAASTAWSAPRAGGSASATTCRRDDRRHRLPDRAAPARSRHRVGLPDGRHRRVAADEPRRPAGGLRHPRRRRVVGRACDDGPARAGVVHGQAPGDDGRRSRPGRRVLRHDERRGLGAAPTRVRRGRRSPQHLPEIYSLEYADPRRAVKVRIPTPLRSYTDQQKVVEASGATVGAVLDDLDRQFPGHPLPRRRRAGPRAHRT